MSGQLSIKTSVYRCLVIQMSRHTDVSPARQTAALGQGRCPRQTAFPDWHPPEAGHNGFVSQN